MPVVTQLPMRLLALALGVLLLPFAFEALSADHVTDGLFSAAGGLIVGAGRTVGVISCNAALGGD